MTDQPTTPCDLEGAHMLAQLKRLATDLYFTANHVGAEGCAVRLKAKDDEQAVRWAIGKLALKAAGTSDPGNGGIAAKASNTQQDPLIPVLVEALTAVSDMFFARPDMLKALRPLMGPAEHAVCERAASALRLARGEG